MIGASPEERTRRSSRWTAALAKRRVIWISERLRRARSTSLLQMELLASASSRGSVFYVFNSIFVCYIAL